MTLHALFAEQAARTPDAVALIDGTRRVTYAGLDASANRLAHHLREAGVGRETLVAVSLPRSADLFIAVLGVLKAGGAYVPLDASYPRARLTYMLDDCAAPVLVTAGDLAIGPAPGAVRHVRLDRDADAIAAHAVSAPDDVNGPGDLAYVMYTSGSTGVPKGVLGLHRSTINRCAWMWKAYPFRPGEVACQKTAISFIDSVWELFGPLLQGVPTVIATGDDARDPVALVRLLAAHRVTRLVLVPSLLRVILDLDDDLLAPLAALDHWVTSGETLPVRLARRFRERLPHARLINLYGSSEVAGDVTCFDTAEGIDRPAIPIGRPIANTRVYVVDEAGAPCPDGAPGELFIGGANVARGYLGRPELTDERFVPDRFAAPGDAGDPDARLFRTGDRVRVLPDGNLEFLGRTDHQVKVRGNRIELGEVETTLAEHPAVRQCVAATDGDVDAARLVAHLTLEAGAVAPAPRALREHVAAALPDFMVPSVFVVLDGFPLLPNGKVDRAALPAADAAGASADGTPTRTPTERTVAGFYAEVLGLDPARVGADDDFFDLGGDSLMATQVVARIRRGHGRDVPLRAIFDAPTVAGLAAFVDGARDGHDAATAPIVPRDGTVPAPLSFAQQRLWFLEHLDAARSAYNVAIAVRLDGALDVAALAGALDETAARHETLRTTFPDVDGAPVQQVAPTASIPLPIEPVTATDIDARRHAFAHAPFDLARGPLIRATLLRLDAHAHVLLLAMHHSICDEWSIHLLFADLANAYRGTPAPLPPVQYGDYAVWQREQERTGAWDGELEHWRGALAGAPALLELPLDRARPPVQTFRGRCRRFTLPDDVATGLRDLARRAGATLFMTGLAVFNAVVHRATGREQLVIGSPVANRDRPETEPLVGFFLNTLPFVADVRADLPFRALVERTKAAALDAFANQHVPLERVVEALQPPRSPAHAPLFQMMFVLINEPPPTLALPGVEATWLPAATDTSKFDLTFALEEAGDGRLTGWVEYSTDLYDEATIDRLVGHYTTLAAGAVADPDRPVGALPLLTEAERHALVVAANDTAAPLPPAPTVGALLADQIARTPDAPAATGGDETLTYAALGARVNRLAHHLRDLGARPGQFVGVCLDRSLDLLVAQLAVIRSGAAYVPIDPAYPADRVAHMLDDSGAPLLVTHGDLAAALPATAARPVFIDRDADAIAARPADDPPPAAGPDDLAYVIYTSGSTGKPKGVMIEHRALVNFLVSMIERPGLRAGDVLVAVTTSSFDISALELYGPLLTGGHVVLADRATTTDARALAALVRDAGATVMQATPATWRMLIDIGWEGAPALRILCGGEALPRELADRLRPRCAELWNMYGPTETTIWSSVERLVDGDGPVTLGTPIANTQIYLVDASMNPVPLGVPGELVIGGAGLARGYLHLEAMTRERFVPDPFATTPGARVYRTGDLCRRTSRGIEFLGRLDHQVKVRGFRIELGEIEAVLAQHPAVEHAAVVVHDAGDDARLVAYIASRTDVPPSDLRRHLRTQIPDYMVPSLFITLPDLPLTPNGKVDRGALPAPDAAGRAGARERERVSPRTDAERRMAAVWAEVLDVSDVGVNDDFFELGGHSLLAVRLFARLETEFGVVLPLATLFSASTVEQLAERFAGGADTDADADAGTDTDSRAIRLRPGGAPPLFLVPPAGDQVFCFRDLVALVGGGRGAFGIEAPGLDGVAKPLNVMDALAADLAAFVRRIDPRGPHRLLGLCTGGLIVYETARQLAEAGAATDPIILLDTMVPAVAAAAQKRAMAAAAGAAGAGGKIDFRLAAAAARRQAELGGADGSAVTATIARVQRAGEFACRQYDPPPFDGRIILVRADDTDDDQVPDDYGWTDLARGGVEIRRVSCRQAEMVQTPFVEEVARAIADLM